MISIERAAEKIGSLFTQVPQIALILGSGLGDLVEDIKNKNVLPYEDIPNFPLSTVKGHKGNLIMGELSGKKILAMQGRFHYYEGYTMKEITFPIRVMSKLGIETLVVTNAAGGINENFQPGDLMIIEDFINLQGTNPLIGPNLDDFGVRFPDMSMAFDRELRDLIVQCGEELDMPIKRGVYAAMTGPSFETPAEIRMLRLLGADAVGMSTVPEVIVARHSGIRVAGISCISNMAAGILEQPLSHEEVIQTTDRIKGKFKELIKRILLGM